MGSFLDFLQEIFLGKETNTSKIGLSEFKKTQYATIHATKKKSIFVKQKPKELRLSELMRKSAY